MTTAGAAHASMKALPFTDIDTLAEGSDILVLAPHADDEVLGCGGLLREAVSAGYAPAVAIVTDGTGSHPASRRFPPQLLKAMREGEAREAAAILGVAIDRIRFLGLPDTAAPHEGPRFDRAVERIVDLCRDLDCGTICAPWRFDPHCDHLATHLMAAAAAAAAGCRHWSYPVWGWTLAADADLGDVQIAGWRLAIAPHRAIKDHALHAHASQVAGIIDDDPGGFQLTAPILARMTHPFEVFLANP